MQYQTLLLVLFVFVQLSSVHAVTRCGWASDFIKEMGFPNSRNTMVALLGWMQGEGSPCRNNPLDTTESWPHATDCNGAHVKNYASVSDGLQASAKTLRLSYYNNIRARFHANSNAIQIAEAIAASPWGTHDAVAATKYCASNYETCCHHRVA